MKDVRFAVESLLEIIWNDFLKFAQLQRDIGRLENAIHSNQMRTYNLPLSDDIDDILMATQGHWDSYFGEEKEHYYKAVNFESLKKSYETKKFSISQLSAIILQIAKQAITTTSPLQANKNRLNNVRKVEKSDLRH